MRRVWLEQSSAMLRTAYRIDVNVYRYIVNIPHNETQEH